MPGNSKKVCSLKNKNLLFISSHLPSMKVPQAGQKIAYAALRKYSLDFNVYLVSFFNEIEKSCLDTGEREFCKAVHLFEVTNRDRVLSAILNLLLPVRVAVRADYRVRRLLSKLTGEIDFDAVHFEFTSAAYYLRHVPTNATKTITEHDVTYQSIERKWNLAKMPARLFYRIEYERQKTWELKMLSAMDKIIVLNEKDKKLLVSDGISSERVLVVKPQVDPSFRKISRKSVEKRSILFWGAMNRKENIDAVKWFAAEIFPKILMEINDAKLYIVGVDPPPEIIRLSAPHTIVTGFVENPLQYFEKCQIAVAPLRMGAGIKVKVLEYLEAGLPVVATSVGAEGIASDKLFVADDDESFAEAVIKVFASGSGISHLDSIHAVITKDGV
jgi:polysaccharide biosynthesis protein PslH